MASGGRMVGGAEVVLVTHSTRPRGGVVHTLSLAEALAGLGVPVRIVALGVPAEGFFRPTTVPHVIVPAPAPAVTLEQRVADSVDALEAGLRADVAGPVILHAQDCIASRAAMRLRSEARSPVASVIRTVHHVDDFTSEVLVECQRRSIVDPDRVLVVSECWRRTLEGGFGVSAAVVPNGFDVDRFPPVASGERSALRARMDGDRDRFIVLTVGGIEPRKGTATLFAAMGILARTVEPRPVLAVAGGHSYQDHSVYRREALDRLGSLGLVAGRDVVLLGTLSDRDLAVAYASADAFAFPSTVEGFGLAVLEAAAARLPLVTSDIEPFTEYLRPGTDALMVPAGDATALAAALARLAREPTLRHRMAEAGPAIAARFTWKASARRHRAIYADAGLRISSGCPGSLTSTA